MVDKLGQEIKPGAWIIYGHALGRCAGLRVGKVLKIALGPETDMPWNRRDRISVWGFDDDHIDYFRHNPGDKWAEPKPLSKPSTVLFSSRCVVVPESFVPWYYIKAIDELIAAKGFR